MLLTWQTPGKLRVNSAVAAVAAPTLASSTPLAKAHLQVIYICDEVKRAAAHGNRATGQHGNRATGQQGNKVKRALRGSGGNS